MSTAQRRKRASRSACYSFVQIICFGRVRIEPDDRHARPVLLWARMQRARDGTLSKGTPDLRPATRSDGSGGGVANRLKFRGQPTIVGRLSMTAARAVPCPPLSASETA